ncbi:CRAL/TRIO domain-containing protein [Skeletonema marinoi]|uniref:CRAL/TRIO domain-containing protein n=1 Tax=Skeletonema marinoi TaxID=267567 RepID=A0AAD9DHE2_9STRA|nr:CRAL/TRIO domain-containing protein [Skeletonema marinoi]
MADKKMAKLKSKLGCISTLFTCFNPSKKKSRKEKKNAVDIDNVEKLDKLEKLDIINEQTTLEKHIEKRPISPNIGSCGSVTSARSGRSSVFFETNEGTDDQWYQEVNSFDSFVTHEIDGQFFFSAKDDPKISQEAFEGIHLYPPIPTVVVDSAPTTPVTTTNMKTLLRSYQYGEEDVQQLQQNKDATEKAGLALEHQAQRLMSITEKQDANEIFDCTNVLLEELKIPGVVSEKGFPGALTEEELEAVKRFQSELKSRDPIYSEIVRSFSVVEKEAYSLCRWLRARKFDVDAVFEMLDEAKEHYEKAKKHDFYPNLEESLGFSRDVFLSQYPEVYSGNARNGCPVMYTKLGSIQPEGIKCLVLVEDADRFFWNGNMHGYTDRLEEGRRINPNFLRTENITVYDLEGVSRSQVNSDTLDMVKVGAKVMSCFPETLHCLLIINAPSWFGLVWSVVRKLIDARTASKIEVFTSSKKGFARMRDLIDNSQIPSDYGGTGPSLAQAASGVVSATPRSASNPQDRNKVVVLNKVMHLKNRQEKSKDFTLEECQTMTVTIYTRCKNGAKASIIREGSESPMIEKDVVGEEEDKPYSMVLGEVKGPGNFEVRLKSISGPGVFLTLGKV